MLELIRNVTLNLVILSLVVLILSYFQNVTAKISQGKPGRFAVFGK